MFCKNCGVQLPDDAAFCSSCGLKLKQQTKVRTNKISFGRKIKTAGLFVLLCGVLITVMLIAKNYFNVNNVKVINLVQQKISENGEKYYLIKGIDNPEEPDSTTSEWSNGKGSYVYFGNYYQSSINVKEPIKWRVLSTDTSEYGTENTMFLQSDKILDQVEFNREEDITGTISNDWLYCSLRRWLNSSYLMPLESVNGGTYTTGGFLNTAFDEVEKNAIAYSVKEANNEEYYKKFYRDSSGLESDKIFVLSIEESDNDKYGFMHTSDYTKTRNLDITSYAAQQGCIEDGEWWLRSKAENYGFSTYPIARAGSAWKYHSELTNVADTDVGVAPALNLTLQSIAFTTDINYTKGGFGIIDDARVIDGWKLTLYGGDGFLACIKEESVVKKGESIAISVNDLGTSQSGVHYTQISAMLVSNDNEVVCYGSISNHAVIGTVEIPIPKDKELKRGKYNLLIFAEQVNSGNGSQCTDYVSNMVTIPIKIK